ncbi:hypothetical protein Cni_G26772 [Canna indica]|uniref:Uncharacterized protein n=1 Tax=Canna indica TaxID=4628 RepID=A0AAQ3L0F7_9LILI|nr:hypothetical protein Cni_G26772 [Canna indica]
MAHPNSLMRAKPVLLSIILSLSVSSAALTTTAPPTTENAGSDPTPAPWPLQFHALLFMNYSGALSLIDLWYDWPGGRNFNIIRDQLDGPPFYDLEWTNGTSFFYTLDSPRSCRSAQLDVGILRPNWLDGATYLGQQTVDGFLCNVWTKVDFIWYYEDVITKRPVQWVFYTGRAAHVMIYEEGAVLEDDKWQAPVYCFQKEEDESPEHQSTISEIMDLKRSSTFLRGI